MTLTNRSTTRPRGEAAKQRLLDSVIEHFVTDGLADQSLRSIAEAVGDEVLHRRAEQPLLRQLPARPGHLLVVSDMYQMVH